MVEDFQKSVPDYESHDYYDKRPNFGTPEQSPADEEDATGDEQREVEISGDRRQLGHLTKRS